MGVTQKDIADYLNLSINTVSRSLRDMSDISDATKQRVIQAAQQMGYHKNLAASRLRTNRSHILGIVVTDFNNPSMASIIRGVESVAKRAGFTLMLGSTNENAEDESAVVRNMLEQGVDGLVLIPSMQNEDLLRQIEQMGTPYVLALRKYPNHLCNSINVNDTIGAAMLADHLVQLGHRKFLYVAGLNHLSPTHDRYAGFIAELALHGLSEDDVQVIHCNGSRMHAWHMMREWLAGQDVNHLSASAVFCFSDYVACGVYSALAERGLHIPQDISVVGFDNNEFSDILVPSLTTMSCHYDDIGRRAVSQLIVMLQRDEEDAPPLVYVNTPELVVRESSAPPKEE